LEIRRRLAQSNPQAYEPDVAQALNNLAVLYQGTQRFTESEAMYKESLEIRRRLTQTNPQAYEPYVAKTQYNIGFLKLRQEQYAAAIPAFEESLEIYRRIAKINPAQQQWYENSLYFLSQLYPAVKNYSSAYRINQEWLPIAKKKYEESPENLKGDYAGAVGSQSWYAIFMKQYTESEQLAREGLSVDSTKHFIYSNLAAALLFQGKYTEAEKIYQQYKSELKDGFLDDFQQFAEAGVIPKEREADVERIKKMLNEE
jgi:tetratricopeptide (TPR) repeat protein